MCNNCSVNCKNCSSKICHECEVNFYQIHTNMKSCSKCKNSTEFLDLPNKICYSPCVPNCSECSGKKECNLCDNSFYMQLPSRENCIYCNSTGQIKNDSNASNKTCTTCVSNCKICQNSSNCNECNVGYYLKSGKCVKCPQNCMHCNETKCINCSISYFFNSTNMSECVSCNTTGYFKNLTSKKCDKCIPNCDMCSDMYTCNNCSKNLFVMYPDQKECVLCNKSGQYQNMSEKSCYNCGSNCSKCQSMSMCATCSPKFYVNPINLTHNNCSKCMNNCMKCSKDACINCDTGFYKKYPNGSNCLKCDASGEFLDNVNNICYSPCVQNCSSCLTNKTCGKCENNLFRIHPKNDSCIACNQTSQSKNFSDHSCRICSSNCKNCKDNSTCLMCMEGYFLDKNGLCAKCPLNCKMCTNSSICLNCSKDYYLNSTNMSECTNCASSGYFKYISALNQFHCLKCFSNCKICSSNKTCQNCENSFFKLLPTFDECTNCNMVGYFANTSNWSCYNCSANCKVCNSSFNCKTCKEGFFYDNKTKSCNKCLNECANCNEESKCLTCNKNRYKKNSPLFNECSLCNSSGEFHTNDSSGNGVCYNCGMNCLTCLNQTACYKCSAGFFLNLVTKKCDKCPDRCLSCKNSSFCNICKINNYLTKNSDSCIQNCDSYGMVKSGSSDGSGKCHFCVLNCNICMNESACLTCNSSKFLHLPKKNLCDDCMNESYWKNISNKTCSICDMNCKTCDGQKSCAVCKEKYFSNNQKKCELCLSNCSICKNQSKCTTCMSNHYALLPNLDECLPCEKEGQYKDINDKTCSKCAAFCKTCKNKTACQDCQMGYFLNSSKCSPCFPSCESCSNGTECLKCKNQLFLMKPDNKMCTDCKKSGYYQNLTKKTCHHCDMNCETCLNETTCKMCKPSFFLNSSKKCSKCLINCDKCDNANNCTKCLLGFSLLKPNNSKCTICSDKGFFNNTLEKTCTKCANNCSKCKNETACSNCDLKFFKAINETCDSCLSGCSVCSAKDKCDVCENTLFLTLPINFQCIKCDQSGQWKNNISKTCQTECVKNCSECESSTICKKCNTNLFLVNPAKTACVLCDGAGEVSNKSTNSCLINCGINCQQCLNETSCKKCLRGFYLLSNGSCGKCISNCDVCTDNTTCGQCSQSYFKILPENKKCGSCNSDGNYRNISAGTCINNCQKNCKTCLSSNKCSVCLPRFFLDENKSCIPCIANCSDCISNHSCSLCEPLYFKMLPFGDKCTKCDKDGYFKNVQNKTCAKCLKNCKICNSSMNCSECLMGFSPEMQSKMCNCLSPKVENGSQCITCDKLFYQNCAKCNKTNCHECKSGFYKLNNSCGKCIDKCSKCENSTTCMKCDLNYYLLNKNSCIFCNDSGYKRNTNDFTCLKCPAFCDRCNSNGECINCMFSFVRENSTCKCEKGKINNGTHCQTCQEKFNKNCLECNKTFCLKCAPRFYNKLQNSSLQNPGECKPCSAQCLNCSSSVSCLNCEKMYFLNNSTKSCNKCADFCDICNGSMGNACSKCSLNYTLTTLPNMEKKCSYDCNLLNIKNCQICMKNNLNISICTLCKPKFYNKNGTCMNCSSKCKECMNSPENCSSCLSGQILENMTCIWNCHKNCLTCNGLTSTNCLSCQSSKYFISSNKTCMDCSINCKSCTGPSNKECLSCFDKSHLLKGECIKDSHLDNIINNTNIDTLNSSGINNYSAILKSRYSGLFISGKSFTGLNYVCVSNSNCSKSGKCFNGKCKCNSGYSGENCQFNESSKLYVQKKLTMVTDKVKKLLKDSNTDFNLMSETIKSITDIKAAFNKDLLKKSSDNLHSLLDGVKNLNSKGKGNSLEILSNIIDIIHDNKNIDDKVNHAKDYKKLINKFSEKIGESFLADNNKKDQDLVSENLIYHTKKLEKNLNNEIKINLMSSDQSTIYKILIPKENLPQIFSAASKLMTQTIIHKKNPYEYENNLNLTSGVLSFEIKGQNQAVVGLKDLKKKIILVIPKLHIQASGKSECVYFDKNKKKWSKMGLGTNKEEQDVIECSTDHLSEFSSNEIIVMPIPQENPIIKINDNYGFAASLACILLFLVSIPFVNLHANSTRKINYRTVQQSTEKKENAKNALELSKLGDPEDTVNNRQLRNDELEPWMTFPFYSILHTENKSLRIQKLSYLIISTISYIMFLSLFINLHNSSPSVIIFLFIYFFDNIFYFLEF